MRGKPIRLVLTSLAGLLVAGCLVPVPVYEDDDHHYRGGHARGHYREYDRWDGHRGHRDHGHWRDHRRGERRHHGDGDRRWR